MRRSKVKLNFKSLSDGGLLTKAQLVTSSMLDLPVLFPAPHPELDAAVTATAAYSGALLVAINGSRADVAVKDVKRLELEAAMDQLSNYVMLVANSDRSVMVASNFDVTRLPEEPSVLVNPEILGLFYGLNPGELRVAIRKVAGAKAYLYQITDTDPNQPDAVWVSFNSTTTRYTFTGLQSGKRYWVRVVAIGSRNQEAYSTVVNKVAQ